MFRFDIPSSLLADWQDALQQCCNANHAQGQVYAFNDNEQWQHSALSTAEQNHDAIVAEIEQITAQFTPFN